jgi:DNA (cytosine-5)-methyltransferase 1
MKLLDLFSGIGGFHKGFEQAGYNFEWVGFSDIDKYASAVYKYRYPNAKELGNITTIRPERDLPDHIDILCGGFPCQSFSMAGKRKGFDDTRGTLFFEIERILRHFRDIKKPIPYFVLENVKGLLSHDNGRTFAIIYGILTDLGYTVECQLLNTRWVLPQNRERIYIVGHIGKGSRAKVFPIAEDGKLSNELKKPTQYTGTITSRYHKMGDMDTYIKTKKTTSHLIRGGSQTNASTMKECSTALTEAMGKGGGHTPILIKEATKKGYSKAEIGDSINLSVPNSKTRRGRVGKGIAQTLDTGMQQYTLDKTQVRRLTPVECMRLQGFPDHWNEKGILNNKVVDISDTQRYRQAGNAVTVSIVQLIAEKIKLSLLNE